MTLYVATGLVLPLFLCLLQALDVIEESLNDVHIRKGHRYALFQRAQKICSTASNKLQTRWSCFESDVMNCVQPPQEVLDF